jgi:hypothetical protein
MIGVGVIGYGYWGPNLVWCSCSKRPQRRFDNADGLWNWRQCS